LGCSKGSTKLLTPYINYLFRNTNIYNTSIFFTTSSSLAIPLTKFSCPHFTGPHAKLKYSACTCRSTAEILTGTMIVWGEAHGCQGRSTPTPPAHLISQHPIGKRQYGSIGSMCTQWAEFINTVEISEGYEKLEQQKSRMKIKLVKNRAWWQTVAVLCPF